MEWYYILIISLLSAILLFIIFILITGGMFYHVTFSRRKHDKHFSKLESEKDKMHPARLWFRAQKIEEYTLKSYDNKKLKGYMIRNNSNKVAFLIHGYRGRYYSLAIQAKIFYQAGYNVFCINHRASDSSSGHWFSMGPKEVKDMIDWLNLLIKENNNYEFTILGVSMGGHIAMMLAGNPLLPNNVKCIIEDCGYASLKDEIVHNLKNYHLPKSIEKFIFWCGKIVGTIFHKNNLNSDTKDSLTKSKVPVLFIHGDKDTYVPYSNLEINFNNMSNEQYKEKYTFVGAKHAESYKLFEEQYKDLIIKFSEKFNK